MREYKFARATSADNTTLLEKFENEQRGGSFSLNSKTFRAVSTKAAFSQLIGSIYRTNKEELESMHNVFAKLAIGELHIDGRILNRFGSALCKALGHETLPSDAEVFEILKIMANEFEKVNYFLEAKMFVSSKPTEKVVVTAAN